jgi:uncharacterized membrane protein YdbT with pleckstrin-like domain
MTVLNNFILIIYYILFIYILYTLLLLVLYINFSHNSIQINKAIFNKSKYFKNLEKIRNTLKKKKIK